MRKVKIINFMRRYGLLFLVLLLFAGFFFYCRSRVQTEFPVISPQDGVADLRNIDLNAGVYHLENHWDYYPGKLYEPEELASPDAPQKNDAAPIDDKLGTWCIVLLAKPNTSFSLRSSWYCQPVILLSDHNPWCFCAIFVTTSVYRFFSGAYIALCVITEKNASGLLM